MSCTTLAGNAHIQAHHAALHDSVQLIGSLQIQNRATLGGNICNAAPSADAVPALIADGAIARIAGPDGERTLALEDLFAGPGKTHLEPGELLVSITSAETGGALGSAYLRFTPRREMDIAVVGAAARIDLDEVAQSPVRALRSRRSRRHRSRAIRRTGLIGQPATAPRLPPLRPRRNPMRRRSPTHAAAPTTAAI